MRVKRQKTHQLLADLSQEVIVISSDSEDEPPQNKVKIELASEIKNEPLISYESEDDVFVEIAIIRQLKVSKMEHLKAIPRCWPVWEQHTAFILDLSQDDREWENSENEPISMETVIREHDQDNWGGSGGHHTDESKCPHVTVLDNQQCQHVILKCQGCYTCSYLDPTLLQNCIRQEYDNDQMRNIWEAERKLNEQQGGTVQGITATFYNQIQKHVCSYKNIVCEGQPVMRKWKKHAQSLDGKAYFVGCSAWKRADPKQMHRFLPIPYNVDEELLLKMIQKHGDLLDEEIANPTCALVVPCHIGSQMKQCSYPHAEDGQVVAGQIRVRKCPAELDIFVPLNSEDHRACIVPRIHPHNHPAYPEHKLSADAKQKYAEAVEYFGAMAATVGKVDKAPSTKKILGERIIKKLKEKQAPNGFGLPGILARREEQKSLPTEKQYIHRISDVAAAKMHIVHASLHDNTYKRTFGKWKEWEVVVWDDRLNMHMWLGYSCLMVTWIYCDSESADVFEHIWTVFFDVLEEVTGKLLKLFAFHKEGTYYAVLVDGDPGQAIGLGKYLRKINIPHISGIQTIDPAVLVQYILKTCWTHCTKNLDILSTHLDQPEDIKYLRSFEHMETDAEIEEFWKWCRDHPVKAMRDWYENKVRHRWYLPSLNPHFSHIRRDHWALTPKNTNFGESAHAHTNLSTGIGLTLLAAIDVAYKYDLEREEEMLHAEEHCMLVNSRNTLSHCMQHNAARAAYHAQAAQERETDAQKTQELEELRDSLAAELESHQAPTLLTTEERHTSVERSKLLKTRMEKLCSEGVTLCRGRKPKSVMMPASQLPNAPAPLMSSGLPFPPSTCPELQLDPELDPANFDWSNLSYSDVCSTDFTLTDQFLVGVGGLGEVGEVKEAGLSDWIAGH
ncbi:hypothetical protein K439DRAFT_1617794 [Ramaria rubella]|nr:hypothetical protein K439DRAFT_1617794 [Ramaria rubella]